MANQRGTVRRDGLTIEYDQEHCYTEFGSCAIQIWRGEVLASHMPMMRSRWEALIERKGSMCMVIVVLGSAPPPSTARRQDIKDIYVGISDHLEAIVSVFEGQGLKGTTASLVMSTMLLLAKSTYPTKNTTSIRSATDWLAENAERISSDKLRDAVESAMKNYEIICKKQLSEGLVPTRQEIRERAQSA